MALVPFTFWNQECAKWWFQLTAKCAFARRSSIQMLKNALSLGACRPKCARMCSRSTPAGRYSPIYSSSGLPFGRPPDKYLPCCPPWPRLSTDSQNTERHRHPQSSATCGAQPDRAKRGAPSERSEVLRCERSEPVMPRRRRRVKLGCVETRMCPN